jgi:hypothetical protein
MTNEELKIAASTPGGQLKAAGILERGPLKRAPRRQIIHDSAQPGVGLARYASIRETSAGAGFDLISWSIWRGENTSPAVRLLGRRGHRIWAARCEIVLWLTL